MAKFQQISQHTGISIDKSTSTSAKKFRKERFHANMIFLLISFLPSFLLSLLSLFVLSFLRSFIPSFLRSFLLPSLLPSFPFLIHFFIPSFLSVLHFWTTKFHFVVEHELELTSTSLIKTLATARTHRTSTFSLINKMSYCEPEILSYPHNGTMLSLITSINNAMHYAFTYLNS